MSRMTLAGNSENPATCEAMRRTYVVLDKFHTDGRHLAE